MMSPSHYCQTVRTEDKRCDHPIIDRLSELKTDDVTDPLLAKCQNCTDDGTDPLLAEYDVTDPLLVDCQNCRQTMGPTHYWQNVRTVDRRCDSPITDILSKPKTVVVTDQLLPDYDVTDPLLVDCQNCRQTMGPTHYWQNVRTVDRRCDCPITDRMSEL
ncbi:unnamed protein product [Mytilus edulis]|uniref:Uncharacterized protein n=1 Tax=Mytilus edulis TaxID=6550 RepID=A0A8S3TKV5_MYTED|nr:unnamed protein product [Mytilus edulis]